jgi:hypothetical protein
MSCIVTDAKLNDKVPTPSFIPTRPELTLGGDGARLRGSKVLTEGRWPTRGRVDLELSKLRPVSKLGGFGTEPRRVPSKVRGE